MSAPLPLPNASDLCFHIIHWNGFLKKTPKNKHRPQTTRTNRTNISLFLLIPLPEHQAQGRAFPATEITGPSTATPAPGGNSNR